VAVSSPMDTVDATCATDMIRLKTSDSSESEKYMMSDASHVAQQELDKEDKTMATRDAGLTKEQVEAAEVHAAGSSHCGEIKSKRAFSRYSTGTHRHRTGRGGGLRQSHTHSRQRQQSQITGLCTGCNRRRGSACVYAHQHTRVARRDHHERGSTAHRA
jgi:hypothetical protein